MKSAAITFAVGVALLAAAAIAVMLLSVPSRVVRVGKPGARAVGPAGAHVLAATTGSPTICQDGEVLPAGISGVRLSLWAFAGARVRVMAYRGSHLLLEGSHDADWIGDSVTVPVRPLRYQVSDARLCVAVGPNSEPLLLLGPTTPKRSGALVASYGTPVADLVAGKARQMHGRVSIEYLAPTHRSWWSRLLEVARHLGLGRAYSGTWIALLLAALMLAVAALAIRSTLRELR